MNPLLQTLCIIAVFTSVTLSSVPHTSAYSYSQSSYPSATNNPSNDGCNGCGGGYSQSSYPRTGGGNSQGGSNNPADKGQVNYSQSSYPSSGGGGGGRDAGASSPSGDRGAGVRTYEQSAYTGGGSGMNGTQPRDSSQNAPQGSSNDGGFGGSLIRNIVTWSNRLAEQTIDQIQKTAQGVLEKAKRAAGIPEKDTFTTLSEITPRPKITAPSKTTTDGITGETRPVSVPSTIQTLIDGKKAGTLTEAQVKEYEQMNLEEAKRRFGVELERRREGAVPDSIKDSFVTTPEERIIEGGQGDVGDELTEDQNMNRDGSVPQSILDQYNTPNEDASLPQTVPPTDKKAVDLSYLPFTPAEKEKFEKATTPEVKSPYDYLFDGYQDESDIPEATKNWSKEDFDKAVKYLKDFNPNGTEVIRTDAKELEEAYRKNANITIESDVEFTGVNPLTLTQVLEAVAKTGIKIKVTAGHAEDGHAAESQHKVDGESALDLKLDVAGLTEEQIKEKTLEFGRTLSALGVKNIGIYSEPGKLHVDNGIRGFANKEEGDRWGWDSTTSRWKATGWRGDFVEDHIAGEFENHKNITPIHTGVTTLIVPAGGNLQTTKLVQTLDTLQNERFPEQTEKPKTLEQDVDDLLKVTDSDSGITKGLKRLAQSVTNLPGIRNGIKLVSGLSSLLGSFGGNGSTTENTESDKTEKATSTCSNTQFCN